MKHTPRVAVIMSVYKSDSLECFKIAVDSILNQDYPALDLFIWQDGPVPDVITHYLDKLCQNDSVIVNKAERNMGLASALNSMIEKILEDDQYVYIARMDSDDISYTTRISKQVDFLTQNLDVDVLGAGCSEFGGSFALEAKILPSEHQQLVDFTIVRCPFIHPTVMFRATVFKNTGLRYPTNTQLTEDLGLWFELLCNGAKFANLPDILLDYRLNEATLARRKGAAKAWSEVKIRIKYMKRLNRFSLRNLAGVFSRLVFHLLPICFIRLAYKYLR